jgi:hypothetical protein
MKRSLIVLATLFLALLAAAPVAARPQAVTLPISYDEWPFQGDDWFTLFEDELGPNDPPDWQTPEEYLNNGAKVTEGRYAQFALYDWGETVDVSDLYISVAGSANTYVAGVCYWGVEHVTLIDFSLSPDDYHWNYATPLTCDRMGLTFGPSPGRVQGNYTNWSALYNIQIVASGGEGPPEEDLRPVTTADELDINAAHTLITTTDFANVYAVADGEITGLVETASGWHVELTTWRDEVVTYEGLSETYVNLGNDVSASCLIGISGHATRREFDDDLGDYTNELDFVWLDEFDAAVDWYEYEDPSGNTPCSPDLHTDTCLTSNPGLDDKGKAWEFKVDVGDEYQKEGGIITVRPGNQVLQNLVGLEAGTYYLTLMGYTAANPGKLTVYLGDDVVYNVQPDTPGDFRLEVELNPTEPNMVPDIWTLRVYVMAGEFDFDYICLHDSEEDLLYSACYFKDSEFDKPDEWTLGGSAKFMQAPITGGAVGLPLNASVTQTASLTGNVDSAEEYGVRIFALLAPVDDADDLYSTDETGTLDVTLDVHDLGDFTVDRYLVYTRYELSFEVPADTTWTGDFTLETTALDDPGPDRIHVSSVCVYPVDGTWPGDAYGEEPAATLCESCEMPESLVDLWGWFAWLGCLMRSLWFCWIQKEVANIVKGVFGLLTQIEYVVLWLSATVYKLAKFAGELALKAGAFVGDMLAFVTGDLWSKLWTLAISKDLFDMFSLSKLWANALKELFTTLVDLAERVIKGIATLLKLAYRIVAIFVDAVNSNSTTTDFGFIDCDPELPDEDPSAPYCWGLKVIDEAFDEAPWLGWIVIVIEGGLGLFMLWWTINRFRKAFIPEVDG